MTVPLPMLWKTCRSRRCDYHLFRRMRSRVLFRVRTDEPLTLVRLFDGEFVADTGSRVLFRVRTDKPLTLVRLFDGEFVADTGWVVRVCCGVLDKPLTRFDAEKNTHASSNFLFSFPLRVVKSSSIL